MSEKGEEIEGREKWFKFYMSRIESNDIRKREQVDKFFGCPCCGYPTIEEVAGYEVCYLCGWEDDGQNDPFAGEIWGGPNADYSLTEARENFKKHQTMYRPSGKTENSLTEIKGEIIRLFSELSLIAGNNERAEIWSRIEELKNKLYGA